MLNIDKILLELRYRLQRAEENLAESCEFGTNSPGFNQDLGIRDTIREIINWLESEFYSIPDR